jgi:FkbM family methyltransferase
MTFISYAQNFEDVMLWRALKHIECGFYIDVGANDPKIDSVTKAFYDRGWRGINIEPVAQWYEKLQEERVRDINLQLAIGAEAGELTFYELPDTGLSTIDKSIAERHEAERGYKKQEYLVPVKTMTEICKHYHEAPIHFLKIDVEGAEKQVLAGLDLTKIRPWIIVVESTLPNTQLEDYEEWEPIILGSGYDYVYFDGLNRFYVANEHVELKASFKAPPNFFDNFIRSQQLNSEARAQELEQRAVAAEARAQELEQRAVAAEARAQELEQRAVAAEARAQELEQRAVAAEARAQELEQRAVAAEARAQELEQRAVAAEARAQELEQRAVAAEARAQELEQRAVAAEARAQELEQRAVAAEARAQELEQRAVAAEVRAQELEQRAVAAEVRVQEQQVRIDELGGNSHHWWLKACALEADRNSLRQSWSWRITAPVRWIGGLAIHGASALRRGVNEVVRVSIDTFQRPLARLMRIVLSKPLLSERINRILLRYPPLHRQLLGVAKQGGLIPSSPMYHPPLEQKSIDQSSKQATPAELSQLTPRARQIYHDLRTAIESQRDAPHITKTSA